VEWKLLDDRIRPRLLASREPLHAAVTSVEAGHGWRVCVAQPGKYWERTAGGDFLVRVSSRAVRWEARPFTLNDLFEDIASKLPAPMSERLRLAADLVWVVSEGRDPMSLTDRKRSYPGLEHGALLTAQQCLALAEHRRFEEFEPEGGKNLALRYSLGILFGKWEVGAVMEASLHGRHGLRLLRTRFGREPSLKYVIKSSAA